MYKLKYFDNIIVVRARNLCNEILEGRISWEQRAWQMDGRHQGLVKQNSGGMYNDCQRQKSVKIVDTSYMVVDIKARFPLPELTARVNGPS